MAKKGKKTNEIDPFEELNGETFGGAQTPPQSPDKRLSFPRGKKKKRRVYRKRQTSIYFLLWAVFFVFSILIVALLWISQQIMLERTYKQEAEREVGQKGGKIAMQVLNPPPYFANDMSAWLRSLSATYDVLVFVLDADGDMVFPHEAGGDVKAELPDSLDFSGEIKTLLAHLQADGSPTVYEGDGKYIYGATLDLGDGEEGYLYVTKSLHLMENVLSEMRLRMAFVIVFVALVAFAVASAVSGWVTKPITEMSKKARLLARGDFNVDFYGGDYSEEMVELADALNFARDELSKTDNMQKELIANVSHDFKTPLTMIKAYASMIVEISGDNPEKRNKHAQVIVDEADRLAMLVSDVLDLSKIRSGIDVLKLSEVDMSSYVEEILDRFHYLKETQGYVFVTNVEDGLYTRADEMKIGQVLYNLIGNAVNYTGENKTVYVSLQKIEDNRFRFSVRDTGKGIKEEELATIWDRYYRSKEMHKRPVQGTGLGLSIVKTVLEKHGFTFGVESAVGQGSTFYVDFPLVDEKK